MYSYYVTPVDKKITRVARVIMFVFITLVHNRRETIATRLRTAIKSLFAHIGIDFAGTATICIRCQAIFTGYNIFCLGFSRRLWFRLVWILDRTISIVFKPQNLFIICFCVLAFIGDAVFIGWVLLVLINRSLTRVVDCRVIAGLAIGNQCAV